MLFFRGEDGGASSPKAAAADNHKCRDAEDELKADGKWTWLPGRGKRENVTFLFFSTPYRIISHEVKMVT